jgi:hypothetical protein
MRRGLARCLLQTSRAAGEACGASLPALPSGAAVESSSYVGSAQLQQSAGQQGPALWHLRLLALLTPPPLAGHSLGAPVGPCRAVGARHHTAAEQGSRSARPLVGFAAGSYTSTLAAAAGEAARKQAAKAPSRRRRQSVPGSPDTRKGPQSAKDGLAGRARAALEDEQPASEQPTPAALSLSDLTAGTTGRALPGWQAARIEQGVSFVQVGSLRASGVGPHAHLRPALEPALSRPRRPCPAPIQVGPPLRASPAGATADGVATWAPQPSQADTQGLEGLHAYGGAAAGATHTGPPALDAPARGPAPSPLLTQQSDEVSDEEAPAPSTWGPGLRVRLVPPSARLQPPLAPSAAKVRAAETTSPRSRRA